MPSRCVPQSFVVFVGMVYGGMPPATTLAMAQLTSVAALCPCMVTRCTVHLCVCHMIYSMLPYDTVIYTLYMASQPETMATVAGDQPADRLYASCLAAHTKWKGTHNKLTLPYSICQRMNASVTVVQSQM